MLVCTSVLCVSVYIGVYVVCVLVCVWVVCVCASICVLMCCVCVCHCVCVWYKNKGKDKTTSRNKKLDKHINQGNLCSVYLLVFSMKMLAGPIR